MKTHLLTTTIAFILGMGIQQNAHADLKDGLVAHWSFDDCRATDNSGNGHDGTINGNPQCVDGVKGKAFSFDGNFQKISVSDKPELNFGIGSFSTSSWIKSTQKGIGKRIITKRAGTNSGNWYSLALWEGKAWFEIYAGGNVTSQKEVSDGNWHLLTVTRDSVNKKISMYIDGVFDISMPYEGRNLNTYENTPLEIGVWWNESYDSGTLTGLLDDLRIYNRALTEAEVLELYNGGGVVAEKPVLVADTGTTGVCSVSKTAAMQVGGSGMISSSSAAAYDFGGNFSTTKTCTNVGFPADKPKDPFYELVNYVYEKKIDDALAIVPTLAGYFVEKHPFFTNSMIVNGKSIISAKHLTADIKKSLTGLQGIDIKAMGKDFVANIVIDYVSNSVAKQIGGAKGRYTGGAVWFFLKQSWGIYQALGETSGNPALLPLALLKAQSDLLMTVIQKDIKEFGILQTSLVGAIEAKMRSELMKGETILIDDERAYFRAETVSEKNKIRTSMIAKQKAFLKPHLTGKKEFISKNKATQMFNTWKSEFPGQLVKEEFGTRAKLSALISAEKLDEAKTLAEAFFGRSVDVFSDQIVIKDNIVTDF